MNDEERRLETIKWIINLPAPPDLILDAIKVMLT
jgi:hypothetical protein